ncbi:hypothetical protein GQX74_006063 [Glossina fuscipes]|nr:hypothetical protein GQX74_006063 [Glossina fuscipes]
MAKCELTYEVQCSYVNWFKANDICRTMSGRLTSLDNESDLNAIHTYFKKNIPGMRWWWLSSNDLGLEDPNLEYALFVGTVKDLHNNDSNIYMEGVTTGICTFSGVCYAAEESLILSIFCMFSKKLIFLNVPNDDDDDDDDNNNDNVNDVVIVKASQLVEAAKRFMWQQGKMKVTLLYSQVSYSKALVEVERGFPEIQN